MSRLKNKLRNTIFRQDFTISPEIVNMTIKKEKNKYLASTERTFQLKNSGLLCKTILTLEREKLKEKHNTPLTRPEPRLLFLDRSHKHSKTQGTDVTVLQPGALDANPGCREPASGPCLSFPICKWGAQGADGFLRCSHPQVLSSEPGSWRW